MLRQQRKMSRATTRIGGPLKKKTKLLSEDPKKSSKAGILSGGGHKEANRCSPYMFYHGEDIIYDEEVDPTKNVEKPKDSKKKKKKQAGEDAGTPLKPTGEGDDAAAKVGREINEDPRETLTGGWSSPQFRQPMAKLAELDDYDDDFTGGAVLTMIRELRVKREKVRHRKFNTVFERAIPENLTLLQQRLQFEVKNMDGSVPLIRKEHLVSLFKDTYGFECDDVTESICKELDRANTGQIPYEKLMDLIIKYVGTSPWKEDTIQSCFRVFDIDRRGSLNARRIRNMKAAKKRDLYGTSGSNFAMIKALLDHLSAGGDIVLSQRTTTMTLKAFSALMDSTETVVHGFLEEIVREILVKEFRYPRERLLEFPDPPTLYACVSGEVPGYNKEVLSAIPDAHLFFPGLPFVPQNTGPLG